MRRRAWALGAIAVLLTVPALPGQEIPGRARRRTPIVEAVEKVGPTVVNLYSSVDYLSATYFGPRPDKAASLGAGVIIHPSGIVVTNSHVITANLRASALRGIRITVSYRPDWTARADGTMEEYQAKLLGFDPSQDLALLKIDADRSFPSASMGTSSDLMIGETVLAVGNPFGKEGSVTHGIISATNRLFSGPTGDQFEDIIQTDTPLNAGNSGGPLFNILGQLIGINQAIGNDVRMGRAEGQGYAIPVDRLRKLLEEEFRPYALAHSFVGLTLREGVGPATVASVLPDSPASQAGLEVGDRILQLGRYRVADRLGFNLAVFSFEPGAEVDMLVQGSQGERESTLVLMALDQEIQQRLGLTVRILPGADGPIVMAVDPSGPAAGIGIQPDDLLISLDDRRLRTRQDLFEVCRAAPDRVVNVKVRRGRSTYEGGIPVRE